MCRVWFGLLYIGLIILVIFDIIFFLIILAFVFELIFKLMWLIIGLEVRKNGFVIKENYVLVFERLEVRLRGYVFLCNDCW